MAQIAPITRWKSSQCLPGSSWMGAIARRLSALAKAADTSPGFKGFWVVGSGLGFRLLSVLGVFSFESGGL